MNTLLFCRVMGCLTLSMLAALTVYADELDALDLQSAAPAVAPPGAGKLYLEAALGQASPSGQTGTRQVGRLSLDYAITTSLNNGLRATFSNRLDYFDPEPSGTDTIVNSLRELYLSWQNPAATRVLEAGRINLRYGPAYGYNPTDFFRDGSVRALTTFDPLALRENRLGTFMLRGQTLWDGGSLSLALAPKLADQSSNSGWSVDAGATNNRHRALAVLGTQWSPSVNSQTLLYWQDGNSTALGVNVTALVSDATTAHLEITHSSEPTLLTRTQGATTPTVARNRLAGGLTYTTARKLSLTAEYHYNGFAPDSAEWTALNLTDRGNFLVGRLPLQELASRQAYMLYLSQKDLLRQPLELTAMLRLNAQDHSRMSWLELRYRGSRFDLAAQLLHYSGDSGSEYGLVPDSRVVQILGHWFY